ncbi:MAG: chorismate mutase [Bacilli bacterium]
MTKLEQARKKINEIDEKMAKLFEERMEASKEVALYKRKCIANCRQDARKRINFKKSQIC